MAYITGTASNHLDLIMKIRTFLTTNAELVAAGEQWTQVVGNAGSLAAGNMISLRGPGLSNNQAIYTGLGVVATPAGDTYTLQVWGHGGLNTGQAADNQPLQSDPTFVYLWNQPMTYWLIANGRRWILVVKVSTVYSSCYAGFILPFATPAEYPYPSFVGGTSRTDRRWSSTDERDRFFASPGYQAASLFWPDNVWRYVYNHSNTNNNYTNDRGPGYMSPTRFMSGSELASPSDDDLTNSLGKALDGSYLMRDLIIHSLVPYRAVMGALDGAFWVPGRQNSSENIITRNGVDHLVVQNLGRTGFRDYMAVRLS